MKEIVLVDDISSISGNIFSFKYKDKVIRKTPFKLKQKPELNNSSTYHLDKADLIKLSELDPKLKPFNEKETLTKNEYIFLMKCKFYYLIKIGEMINLLSHLYDENLDDYEIKWSGEIPLDRWMSHLYNK